MRRRFVLQPWMLLLALAALLAASMVITFIATDRTPTVLEDAVGGAVAPAQDGAGRATTAVGRFFQRLFGTRDIDREHAQMQDEIAQLRAEIALLEELVPENERLSLLLGAAEQYPQYQFVRARVSAREPAGWFMEFEINKGTRDGVDRDMAVINADGLIGRVVEAGPNYARVLTVIDTRSAVSAIVVRTRDHGIVDGATDPQATQPECMVRYLPVDSDMTPGDQLVTSNLGGVFPRGLVIGTVSEVNRDQNSQSYAVVRPAVDFAHLEDVLVLVGEQDIGGEPEDDTDVD